MKKIFQIYKILLSFLSSIIPASYVPKHNLDHTQEIEQDDDIIDDNMKDHIGSITFSLTPDYDIDIKYELPDIENVGLDKLIVLSEKYASLLLVVNDGQLKDRILEILKDNAKTDDKYTLYIDNILTFYPLLEDEFKKLILKNMRDNEPVIKPSTVFLK